MGDSEPSISVHQGMPGVADLPNLAVSGHGTTGKGSDGTEQAAARNATPFFTPHLSTRRTSEQPATKGTVEKPAAKCTTEQAAARKRKQFFYFRARINKDAKAMLSGLWDSVQKPYNPRIIQDENDKWWRAELRRQQKVEGWMQAANKPSKNPAQVEESRYKVIMKMRDDPAFMSIAEQVAEPRKPASMIKLSPATTVPVTVPSSMAKTSGTSKRKESGGKPVCKQEVINLDPDDKKPVPESEQRYYEPEEEAVVGCGDRATKRKRTETVPSQSLDQEDLSLQVEEVRLKARLDEVQIRRKMLSLRRHNEEAN